MESSMGMQAKGSSPSLSPRKKIKQKEREVWSFPNHGFVLHQPSVLSVTSSVGDKTLKLENYQKQVWPFRNQSLGSGQKRAYVSSSHLRCLRSKPLDKPYTSFIQQIVFRMLALYRALLSMRGSEEIKTARNLFPCSFRVP